MYIYPLEITTFLKTPFKTEIVMLYMMVYSLIVLPLLQEVRQGVLRQLELLVHGLGPGDLASTNRTLVRQVRSCQYQ